MGGSAFVLSRQRLREWMQLSGAIDDEATSSAKRYFEKCVSLFHSLVLKLVITEIANGKAAMEVAVDPKFITCDNLEVHQALDGGESIHFIQSGKDDNTSLLVNQKYPAMKALGVLAYELFMRGTGPNIQAFIPSTATSSDGTARLLLSLDDYDEKSDKAQDGEHNKRHRAHANKQARISAAMIDAGVPYPLCRLTVDLLGGECSDGLLFRSDNSFVSFSDIIQDLEQMTKNPSAFIHLSVRDQWRLAFGEKMHGRETEQKMLLDAASRVTGTKSNDALFEALALMVLPQNKQQIVMVSGQPGCGKSRLVMETRKSLENQGWLFGYS